MTTAFQKCPFCDQTFRGEASPRTVEENAYVQMLKHVPAAHPEKVMKCPRRDEAFSAVSAYPTDDFWRADETCSYCGSMSPTAFFAAIETGLEIGPTDKSYKVYVGDGERRAFYFQHLSAEQQTQFIDLVNSKKAGNLFDSERRAKHDPNVLTCERRGWLKRVICPMGEPPVGWLLTDAGQSEVVNCSAV